MLMLILLVICWSPDQVLVLKNQKKILCDSYEREGSRVTVQRDGQTFSLPTSAIDWNASAKATEQLRAKLARKAEEEAAEAAKKAEGPRYLKRDKVVIDQNITLTNQDYHDNVARVPARASGPVSIQLRRLNNSLLIDVIFNGDGPHTMVLDTGASKTTLSSSLAKKVGLELTGETILVAGVGGMSTAELASANSVMVQGAEVKNMEISVHDIPALTGLGAHGLLGQDFLNHFSMTLDGDSLTLTPSGTGAAKVAANAAGLQILERTPELGERVDEIYKDMRSLSEDFQVTDPIQTGTAKARECRQLIGSIQEANLLMERIQSALQDAELSSAVGVDDRARSGFISCIPKFRDLFNQMTTYTRDLQWSYTNVDSQDKINEERERIVTDFREIFNAYNGLANCIRLKSIATTE